MAGKGPPPQEQTRRSGDGPAVTVLPAEGYSGPSPDLPPYPVESSEWAPAAVLWYEGWRTSPQAAMFGPTDWQFLAETTLIFERVWLGDLSMANELRLRVSKFGATPEDRQRLRWTLGSAELGATLAIAATTAASRPRKAPPRRKSDPRLKAVPNAGTGS